MGEARPLRETLAPAPAISGAGDPLIGALIEKLPRSGTAWSIEQRLVWLRMAAMAFDLAYGVDAPIDISLVGVPKIMAADAGDPGPPRGSREAVINVAGPRLGKQRVPDQRYVICQDGMAWDGDKLILPVQLGNGDIVWDFRPGEQGLERVVWADGETREPHQLPPLQVLKG